VTATELSNCRSAEMAALWSLLTREHTTLTDNASDQGTAIVADGHKVHEQMEIP